MNNLRRIIRPTATQQAIVKSHRNQYVTHWRNKANGDGYVTLKYPDSIQKIVDARRGQRGSGNGSYNGGARSNYDGRGYNGYRRGYGNGYNRGYSHGGNTATPIVGNNNAPF
ncbi:MAG: hypothetical protein NC038_05415 [Paludibacter sp.]|nr:hypothetical protein [Bacteroidales bacterium]MCM1069809.1 hypothetical protein [Prevotella sp.]MCM1353997.1 hypothetical protein [Bacteroides sp.]MCM1443361.1 hypothetical protein [Muribaculum sp.]MCM1482064.1 hypothetical protein [Paludibacter sp.]